MACVFTKETQLATFKRWVFFSLSRALILTQNLYPRALVEFGDNFAWIWNFSHEGFISKKNLMIQRKEEEKWKKGVEECRNWEGENREVVEERKKMRGKTSHVCIG